MQTSQELEHMYQLAHEMLAKAYAPYSKFLVGTCIKTTHGNYYSGCNVENASYSLVICAEGCAVANMVTGGEQSIEAVVIVSSGDLVCGPCGACRQIIREFAKMDPMIYMYDGKKNVVSKKLSELLPLSFGPEHLEV